MDVQILDALVADGEEALWNLLQGSLKKRKVLPAGQKGDFRY
jgi:hypothetical protein